jgi:hypothetical protein
MSILIEQNRVGKLVFIRKDGNRLPGLLNVYIHHDESLLRVAGMNILETGDFIAAGRAPGSAENQQHRFTPLVAQLKFPALQIIQYKIRHLGPLTIGCISGASTGEPLRHVQNNERSHQENGAHGCCYFKFSYHSSLHNHGMSQTEETTILSYFN